MTFDEKRIYQESKSLLREKEDYVIKSFSKIKSLELKNKRKKITQIYFVKWNIFQIY